MSRNPSHERSVTASGEILEIIREEQCSPTVSSVKIDATGNPTIESRSPEPSVECVCPNSEVKEKEIVKEEEIVKLIKEKEVILRSKYQKKLENEIQILKDRFDFILQNEQIRASYMLCEAHRERKEKISALQTQLECKNLAGLMYVLCSERRRTKLEKLQMAQEYTNYIEVLQEILAEAQTLILRLARGYKMASTVDEEWRKKMKNIIKEFQNFVCNFAGGAPETSQYFLNLTEFIKTELPEINLCKDDLSESDVAAANDPEPTETQLWWEMLEGDNAPFVMFGEIAELQAPQKKTVLTAVKSAKAVPKEWKHYVFNDKFLKSECPNADQIKNEYLKHVPIPGKWECSAALSQERDSFSRRMTQASVDVRGNMGSVLKIIASCGHGHPATNATLLGARDSMEIASTTKLSYILTSPTGISVHSVLFTLLREKSRNADHSKEVILNIGSKRVSKFDDYVQDIPMNDTEESVTFERQESTHVEEEEIIEDSFSALGSIHHDSLQVIPSHIPDHDAKINYEKVCPMEECQRMQVDSFLRTLPPYMRASPFTHFETTYEEYEPCTPEQLEILKRRIDSKKKNLKSILEHVEESPLLEWLDSTINSGTVAIQTSEQSVSLPPCTCRDSETEKTKRIYNTNRKSTAEHRPRALGTKLGPEPTASIELPQYCTALEDLVPVKRAINEINQKFFFDSNIEFNRFKVVGQDGKGSVHDIKRLQKNDRVHEINKILRSHPSLYDIFQANTN